MENDIKQLFSTIWFSDNGKIPDAVYRGIEHQLCSCIQAITLGDTRAIPHTTFEFITSIKHLDDSEKEKLERVFLKANELLQKCGLQSVKFTTADFSEVYKDSIHFRDQQFEDDAQKFLDFSCQSYQAGKPHRYPLAALADSVKNALISRSKKGTVQVYYDINDEIPLNLSSDIYDLAKRVQASGVKLSVGEVLNRGKVYSDNMMFVLFKDNDPSGLLDILSKKLKDKTLDYRQAVDTLLDTSSSKEDLERALTNYAHPLSARSDLSKADPRSMTPEDIERKTVLLHNNGRLGVFSNKQIHHLNVNRSGANMSTQDFILVARDLQHERQWDSFRSASTSAQRYVLTTPFSQYSKPIINRSSVEIDSEPFRNMLSKIHQNFPENGILSGVENFISCMKEKHLSRSVHVLPSSGSLREASVPPRISSPSNKPNPW